MFLSIYVWKPVTILKIQISLWIWAVSASSITLLWAPAAFLRQYWWLLWNQTDTNKSYLIEIICAHFWKRIIICFLSPKCLLVLFTSFYFVFVCMCIYITLCKSLAFMLLSYLFEFVKLQFHRVVRVDLIADESSHDGKKQKWLRALKVKPIQIWLKQSLVVKGSFWLITWEHFPSNKPVILIFCVGSVLV